MSRLSFLLGMTLLFVAGAATFMLTFEREPEISEARANPETSSRPIKNRRESDRERPRSRTTSNRSSRERLELKGTATAHLTPENARRVQDILRRTEREARTKLDSLSRKYDLSSNQRREIFPYILAHHDSAHPAMTVAGNALPAINPGTTLEDNISPFLNSEQQDTLVEETLDSEAWWQDVVGQLESDLDAAIENGEMVPAPDDSSGPNLSDTPASGDGEASGESGGNLFDLLGR